MTAVLQLAPGVLRLRAANPSPMTGSGTNTYILHGILHGASGSVVIDPGPALPDHLAAILAHLDGPLASILLTHAHLDHSALIPALKAATAAPVLAFGPAHAGRSAAMQRLAAEGLTGGGEGVDESFTPDQCLTDGQELTLAGLHIEALHTPGHMGCHLSFALGDLLFSGDQVMGWASTLISPPDGDMGAYMASLARLAARRWTRFFPGHGDPIEAPVARLAALAAHRRAREAAILAALQDAPQTPPELTARIYTDTPPALHPAALRNILAHLVDLHERNVVDCPGPPRPDARFHLI